MTATTIIENLLYLQTNGVDTELLSSFHHFKLNGKEVSYPQLLGYFETEKKFQRRNRLFCERLDLIVKRHKESGGSIQLVIREVLQEIPLS